MRYLFICLLAGCLLACNPEKENDGQIPPAIEELQKDVADIEAMLNSKPIFHASPDPTRADTPFSEAVQAGNLYFLSGQIGRDPKTKKLAEGGIRAETRQCLENIKAVLANHGLEMKDVVKALVILDDIGDFAAFNEIYREYLPQKPARTTFAAEALAVGAKIEIEVTAVKPE
ncbi:reactive intermediate/imine deaminase [Lewinellaceae bacterium SD302]|nr:reactive intermediate/imine deaminase [Lewinellaceae bacterium SD302]